MKIYFGIINIRKIKLAFKDPVRFYLKNWFTIITLVLIVGAYGVSSYLDNQDRKIASDVCNTLSYDDPSYYQECFDGMMKDLRKVR